MNVIKMVATTLGWLAIVNATAIRIKLGNARITMNMIIGILTAASTAALAVSTGRDFFASDPSYFNLYAITLSIVSKKASSRREKAFFP